MLAVHNGLAQFVSASEADALTTLGYSGEHFDAFAQQQYLRARFYDAASGQFNRLDPFFGNMQDPQSLHKYAYVHGDPIQGVDPTGMYLGGLGGMLVSIGTRLQLGATGLASASIASHAALDISVASYFLHEQILGFATNLYSLATGKDSRGGDLTLAGYGIGVFILLLDVPPGNLTSPLKSMVAKGAKRIQGRARALDPRVVDRAVDAFKKYVAEQGGINGRLIVGRLADGREIGLSAGIRGMKHILERHVPSYFEGAVKQSTTLFPHGTTPRDIVDMVKEAVQIAGTSLPNAGKSDPIRLRNGFQVTLQMAGDSVKSIWPTKPDKIFGYDVKQLTQEFYK